MMQCSQGCCTISEPLAVICWGGEWPCMIQWQQVLRNSKVWKLFQDSLMLTMHFTACKNWNRKERTINIKAWAGWGGMNFSDRAQVNTWSVSVSNSQQRQSPFSIELSWVSSFSDFSSTEERKRHNISVHLQLQHWLTHFISHNIIPITTWRNFQNRYTNNPNSSGGCSIWMIKVWGAIMFLPNRALCQDASTTCKETLTSQSWRASPTTTVHFYFRTGRDALAINPNVNTHMMPTQYSTIDRDLVQPVLWLMELKLKTKKASQLPRLKRSARKNHDRVNFAFVSLLAYTRHSE